MAINKRAPQHCNNSSNNFVCTSSLQWLMCGNSIGGKILLWLERNVWLPQKPVCNFLASSKPLWIPKNLCAIFVCCIKTLCVTEASVQLSCFIQTLWVLNNLCATSSLHQKPCGSQNATFFLASSKRLNVSTFWLHPKPCAIFFCFI